MSVTLDEGSSRGSRLRAEANRPQVAGGTGRDPSTWAPNEHINRRSSIPFIALHFLPLLAFVTGVTWKAVWLAVILYFVRMFAITAGYHRYFAHRTYRLRRFPQFVLAFVGTSAAQKGPLWWAAHHRAHHKYSDTERDIHSPIRGFWWSHVGWILCDKYNETDSDAIKDFTRYPELVWLDKHDWVAPWTLGVFCYLVAGWSGLIIGFFASTIVLWHATFTVNSLAHVFGRRGVRHDRHEPELAAGRAHHGRRGLAQQPPPLPVGRSAGLPVVADRHDLLPVARVRLRRHRARPAPGPGRGARRGPLARTPPLKKRRH